MKILKGTTPITSSEFPGTVKRGTRFRNGRVPPNLSPDGLKRPVCQKSNTDVGHCDYPDTDRVSDLVVLQSTGDQGDDFACVLFWRTRRHVTRPAATIAVMTTLVLCANPSRVPAATTLKLESVTAVGAPAIFIWIC